MSLLLRSSRLAVLALAAATGAHAAELGDASVRSYSGQPLSADIELTDLTAQELADLQVRLARSEVFEGANVKMHPALAGATIAIVRRDNRRVLHVTTSAPVKAEVLHLYFQLVSGSRERVRGVTLWLSPDPAPASVPAPAPAPAAVLAATAPAPVAAAERAGKPAARQAGTDSAARLVAIASPGKEATSGERALLGAVERAFSTRGGKVESPALSKTRPADAQDVRREAMKHASTADDFRRGGKPVKPVKPAVVEKAPEQQAPEKAEPEKKAPQRSFLASKTELAEAARATKASVEAGTHPAAPQPAAVAQAAPPARPDTKPAGAADDPAMLNKLVELEGKLKTLQAQLGITNQAGAARVSAPLPGPAAPEAPKPAAVPTPDAATVAAAAAAQPAPAQPAAAQATPAKPEAVPHAEDGGEPVAKPKAPPEAKKEAAPPPSEPKKEIKISRPKLLTFLFIGSLVLLVVFGVIVHFIRKAKMKRSPVVRQSWSRDEDDTPARIEPAIAAPAQPESQAA